MMIWCTVKLLHPGFKNFLQFANSLSQQEIQFCCWDYYCRWCSIRWWRRPPKCLACHARRSTNSIACKLVIKEFELALSRHNNTWIARIRSRFLITVRHAKGNIRGHESRSMSLHVCKLSITNSSDVKPWVQFKDFCQHQGFSSISCRKEKQSMLNQSVDHNETMIDR